MYMYGWIYVMLGTVVMVSVMDASRYRYWLVKHEASRGHHLSRHGMDRHWDTLYGTQSDRYVM